MTVASAKYVTEAKKLAERDPLQEGESFRTRWVHHSSRSSTAVTTLRAGQGIRPHTHRDHDEIVIVADGEAEFRLEDATATYGPGVVISVPKGVVHAPILSKEGCLLISVFAPEFDPANPDRHFIEP